MAIGEYKGPERRRFIRLDIDCIVHYVRLSKGLGPVLDFVYETYTKDLSASGIKFVAKEELLPGSILEVHIQLPSIDKFITTIGNVVRCEKLEKGQFGVAAYFLWITKKDQQLIDDYVRKKSLEKLRTEIKE